MHPRAATPEDPEFVNASVLVRMGRREDAIELLLRLENNFDAGGDRVLNLEQP